MNTRNENDHEQAVLPETEGEPSESFRLRAEHPRVTRLSRKVLAGGSAVVLLVIGGVVLWSLQNNRPRNSVADELSSTDHHNVADGITTLPKDYAAVSRQPIPQLGPPLPGDLGRPILAAQGQLPTIGGDPEQQRRDQETEAARISHLFAATNGRGVRPPPLRQLEATASRRRAQRAPATMDLRRTVKTGSLPSSILLWIAARSALTASPGRLRHTSCRLGRSFQEP